ncbi:MAG: hypothetical protein Q4E34_02900 [Synergistaceae bacterium]|nr:hypothetical protein [Synergistaceae bacterium]
MKKLCTGFLMITILFSTMIDCAFAENYRSVGYGAAIDMDSISNHIGEYRAVVKIIPDSKTQHDIYTNLGKRTNYLLYLYAFKKKVKQLRKISLTIVFRDGSTQFFKINDPWEPCVGLGYGWWHVVMKYKGKL